MVLILFGIMVYGLWLSEYQVMQGAAREGARVAATRGVLTSDCTDLSATSVECAIRRHAGPYVSELTNMPPSWSVGGVACGATCCTNQTIGQFVTVTWNQTFKGDLLPLVPPLPNTKDIVGVFRCE